jgi:hypothetical protein
MCSQLLSLAKVEVDVDVDVDAIDQTHALVLMGPNRYYFAFLSESASAANVPILAELIVFHTFGHVDVNP